MQIRFFTFILLTINAIGAFSQRQKDTQGIEWFGTSSAVKLSPKVGIYIDGQERFAKGFQNMQHQIRIALDIYTNNKLNISFFHVLIWVG